MYRGFLHDSIALLGRCFEAGRVLEICWGDTGPPDPTPSGAPPALLAGTLETRQGTGSLGDRLARAFRGAFADGASRVVAIGADSPTLPKGHVDAAFAALRDGADAALADSEDGGYVAIGTAGPHTDLFRAVPWGGSGVARATRANAERAGIELRTLPGWYDVDDADGLERLRDRARRGELAAVAPATARALGAL